MFEATKHTLKAKAYRMRNRAIVYASALAVAYTLGVATPEDNWYHRVVDYFTQEKANSESISKSKLEEIAKE